MTQTLDQRIIDQFNARAPFRLENATVLVLALIGSDSHNTKTPKDDPKSIDDTDYMGVVIPPINYALGLREWEGLNFQFEELDCVFYSFKKFISLLTKNNPNVLGLMYLKPEHYIVQSPEWEMVLRRRDLFPSKKAYGAFMGYAKSQYDKMTHFDLETQQQFDTAIELITAAGWTKDSIIKNSVRPMPNTDRVFDVLGDRYPFTTLTLGTVQRELDAAVETIRSIHAKHFQGYMGEKRKALTRKYGYDTKNAAHLVRLLRMCKEFLQTGTLQVFRTDDAQYIRDIKSGKYELDDVKQEAARLMEEIDVLKTTSPLPDEPHYEGIDRLCVRTYLDTYRLK